TNGFGVYLSNNNGGSWSSVNIGWTNSNVSSIAINGSDIFAGTSGNYGGTVFLSFKDFIRNLGKRLHHEEGA
ncbi:MAG: hypothetical protein WBB36_11225, partial [Chitinophagales bacterium]